MDKKYGISQVNKSRNLAARVWGN